jgi:hypothetical protein
VDGACASRSFARSGLSTPPHSPCTARIARINDNDIQGLVMRTRFLPAMLLALALAACGPIDSLKEGFAHSQAVSASLEKSLGIKPFVGFNWSNGNLDSVTVNFEGIPPNVPLADIAAKAREAITAEFKQAPTQVVIAFALKT